MLDVSDPSVQTLRIEDTQFDLSDIEPASVLGCIDELEPIPECLRYLWRESLNDPGVWVFRLSITSVIFSAPA